ncbi:protein fantom isoform X2 [Aplysia californica]|uniref:Protein fantom isoform X2 n=1 Tax=Aplysia californica TaxID=6500 RepID=A0ABM1W1K6_APLCA|nr:protein fantom isoform X2 [Aplysia californica]
MADDNIPTRDVSNNAIKHLTSEAAQQRQHAAKFSRDELEDKYLRMYEEYIILKKYARKQEDKIKKMATKLLKLVNDKKKMEEGKGGKSAAAASEDRVEEMSAKIRELEKQNGQLREKLMLTKQQLSSVGPKRGTTYHHVQARINTNRPASKLSQSAVQIDPRITRNLRVMGPQPQQSESQLTTNMSSGPRYGHSVLEATRAEKSKLEDYLASMREQNQMYEMQIEELKEQLKLKESEYEEDILKIKQQITSEQKVNLQENIDMIKLQRDVKEKSTMLIALQDRYQHMEESSRAVKQSHDQILREMEHLNLQFQEEQNRNLSLQNELKMAGTSQKKAMELQEQISDLEKECAVLKEANENLVGSAFDLEREREWRQKENALKVQIAQLEATMKSDLGEKGSIIDRYAQERDAHEKLQTENRELKIEYYSLKEQMDDLNEKMKFFTKESEVDFTEIEEALVLIKQKKQREQAPPDFLQAVDDELSKDHRKALVELQAEYAETVHELEKTRNMLVVQHKINKDYQTEVNLATGKLDEVKREYEMKLDEYARLLDIRAARIKKLETQLRDVAYGTRQYRLPPPDDDLDSTADLDETISLERGQNLFEVHIDKVSLSKDALRVIGDEEPSLFCMWDFFEFESLSTPVVRGSRPMFDFTSQYIVKVDDFFLHYLQKDSCRLELYQSFGQDYSKIAVCQLVFRDIFDKPHGRIHGTASLTGTADGETGIGYGTVDYWVRLRVPMEQALRLYKERTKALGYIMANERMATQALEALDETAAQRPPDNVNEMHIKVIRCSKLQPRRQNVQPSPYCAYKLLDFPDHDTIILRSTNNPEFNDHKIYSVPVTFELDQYLRTAKLQIYVFDDTDPEVEAYLGVAEIPLLPLAHDKPVSGDFQLTRGTGKVPAGVIEVEMRWQYTYLPPKVPKHEPQELEMAPDEPPQKLEAEGPPTRQELVGSPPGPQVARAVRKQRGPTATSTPMDKDLLHPSHAQRTETGPKPVSRRKVQISEGSSTEHEDQPEVNEVNDTVAEVISGFMPRMSESISSVPGESSAVTDLGPPSVVEEESAMPGPSAGEESEEGEELQARPSPPRSSLQLESGSEEEYFHAPKSKPNKVPEGKQRPKPKARTQLFMKQARETTPTQESPSRSAAEEEEEEEEVEEEIVEEVLEGEDTLIEEEQEPVVSSARESEASEPPVVESDSEGIMVVQETPARVKRRQAKSNDTVTIVISQLSLEEDSPPMLDDNVRQLYVEYWFYDLEFVETPDSLPKPKPHRSIAFNFSKSIPVDMEKHYERRRHLASMLLPNHQDQGRLKFTVVSEPPQTESLDESVNCEEVGVAYVNFQQMLRQGKDIIDEDIDIVDCHDESILVGQLKLTVECVEVLKAIKSEIQIEETY